MEFFFCLYFFFLNLPHAHVVRKQTSECRGFCRCVEGEYIHTYAQTDRCSYACIHIKHFKHLLLTWACRVLGRYSVRQEWRGWLRLCFQILSVCLYTFSVGTRSPTRPPVGSPLPVFSRIWFTNSEVWPATGDCTAQGETKKKEN